MCNVGHNVILSASEHARGAPATEQLLYWLQSDQFGLLSVWYFVTALKSFLPNTILEINIILISIRFFIFDLHFLSFCLASFLPRQFRRKWRPNMKNVIETKTVLFPTIIVTTMLGLSLPLWRTVWNSVNVSYGPGVQIYQRVINTTIFQ